MEMEVEVEQEESLSITMRQTGMLNIIRKAA